MGLDAYGITVLGVRVQESDFLAVTGTNRGCPSSLSHQNPLNAKFCLECGKKILESPRKEPTAAFAAVSKGLPLKAWSSWVDPVSGTVGIHQINVIQGGVGPEELWALGLKIGETGSHQNTDREGVCATNYSKLERAVAAIKPVAYLLLGEERPIELFTCILLSY